MESSYQVASCAPCSLPPKGNHPIVIPTCFNSGKTQPKRKAAPPGGETAFLARLRMSQPITSEEREVGSFWLEAPWGHRSSFGSFSPRAPQAVRVERRLVWRAAVPTKGPTQVMFEPVGAGARKSVSFFDLLGWTVVAHERLRPRWTYFRRSRNVWHRSNRALLSWEKSPKFSASGRRQPEPFHKHWTRPAAAHIFSSRKGA